MKRIQMYLWLIVLLIAAPGQARADDPVKLLKEAIELLEADNYPEGREVVAIALDQIDHHMLDTTAAIFPEKIGEFTRGEVTSQKTMGIEMTKCTYINAQGQKVEIQLLGGGGGLFGGMADIAGMGGGRKVRINGRSGSAVESNGETTITLKLKNKKSLMFKSDLSREEVTAVAEKFPVAKVDQ